MDLSLDEDEVFPLTRWYFDLVADLFQRGLRERKIDSSRGFPPAFTLFRNAKSE